MSMRLGQTCELCGSTLKVQYLLTPLREVFCVAHRDLPRCRLCAAPYVPLTDRMEYCVACRAGAVEDQATVRQVLPGIRDDLRDMGIRLTQRVRVRLVSRPEIDQLAGGEAGSADGLTTHRERSVLDLAVVSGLPVAKFGLTVTHEAMHAWMAQRGLAAADPTVAEGLCQLVAFRWLKVHGGRGAQILREGIRLRNDAIYGDGFRAVHAAVARYGLGQIRAVVARTGRLP
jgi:hypothetical protein